jgi:hypothetical protein
MSRLADPALCPDCRGRVTPDAVCSACGLALSGPLAVVLWRTMLSADGLVERIRREQAHAPVAPASGSPARPVTSYPVPAPRPAGAAPTAISARTVPVILLGLGGFLVVVAVSLFLAVTWTILPLAVKALLMAGVTAGFGFGAAAVSRRGLRGSAEALWTVTAILLALDLGAAHQSGLLGLDAVPTRTMAALTGVALAGLGLAVALWTHRTPIRRSIAGEATLVVGLLILCASAFWSGPWSGGPGQVVGVLVTVAAAITIRSRLTQASYAVLGLSLVSWLDLATEGASRAVDAGTRQAYWDGFQGWPLLAAAVLAAVVVVLRPLSGLRGRSGLPGLSGLSGLSGAPRTVAAGAALASLALLALLPATWTTLQVLLTAAVVLVLATITRLAPLVWARAAALLGSVGALVAAVALAVSPATWSLTFIDAHPLWDTSGSTRFPVGDGPSAWTVTALLGAAFALGHAARGTLPAAPAARLRAMLTGSAAALAALAVATGLAGSRLPLWLVAVGLAVTAVVATVCAVRADGPARQVCWFVAVEAGGLGLLVATRADLVSAVLASALACAATAVFVRSDRRTTQAPRTATAGAALTVLLVAYAVGAWTLVAQTGDATRAAALAGVACVFLLVAASVTRSASPRVAVEVAAAVVGVAALLVAAPDRDVVALVLTMLGSAAALVSVLRLDRTELGWLASAVLFAATLTRLTTDHRIAPELYALPAAAVLLAVGGYRLVQDERLGTWRMLGSGLTLALLPSLVLAMPEPSSARGLLVGVGGATALVLGLERRWQAPFVTGSGVLAVLALRFLLPLAAEILADPIGAWMLFGAAGSSLLVAGVLWEQSLRNLRFASRFVADLH